MLHLGSAENDKGGMKSVECPTCVIALGNAPNRMLHHVVQEQVLASGVIDGGVWRLLGP